MKILVLNKRQYMGKDLLDDRFGRFWELPLELARLGHEVRGLALSYRRRPGGYVRLWRRLIQQRRDMEFGQFVERISATNRAIYETYIANIAGILSRCHLGVLRRLSRHFP
jgi:hypothetical protein